MTRESENLSFEYRCGTFLMMAIRPWEIGVFRTLRRVSEERGLEQ
jgi:hypothetical protein